MAVIVLGSVAGAPGVTTTAVAAALNWPRPVVLLEADLSRPSSILPGLLRGQVDHSRGLTPLAVDHQRGTLTIDSLWAQTVQIAPDRYLVPGFASPAAARGTTAVFWGRLGETVAALESGNLDVLVDAGRIDVADPRFALMQLADQVTLMARPVLPDVAVLRARRGDVVSQLDAVGKGDAVALALVDADHETFSNAEISRSLGLPVLARLPWDSRTAAVYSVGAASSKKTETSPLGRAIAALTTTTTQAIRDRRARLGVQPTERTEETTTA